MVELRNRKVVELDDDENEIVPTTTKGSKKSGAKDSAPIRFSVLDVLRILGGLFLLNSALSWFVVGDSILWGYRPWYTRLDQIVATIVRFTYPDPSLPLTTI
jgi:hypothetical protein